MSRLLDPDHADLVAEGRLMLVLTRKFGESIVVTDADTGRSLIVTVHRHARRPGCVRLTFEGPRAMRVSRTELLSLPGLPTEPSVSGRTAPAT